MASTDPKPDSVTGPHGDEEVAPSGVPPAKYESSKKPLEFWLVFLGTSMSLFLSALELTSVGTALPTIVSDIGGADFIWIGSAYALAQAAFMPACGSLSNIFGRRPLMLISIAIFSLGSALGGAAKDMTMLIGARTVQGFGGGGIITLTEIIVADLVPLRERGKYGGILGAVWALASVVGPPVGGALATKGQWRWLFYMNLPLSGIAGALVFWFLRMKSPTGRWQDKIGKIDWVGNVLVIASTASIILALTWGGVTYPWSSARVLCPLIIGFAGLVGFMFHQAYVAKQPTVPVRLFQNRTSFSGQTGTFVHGIAITMIVYYLPTYFQGAHGNTAIRSGILLFPACLIVAPVAIVVGQSVERTGRYVPQNYLGWLLIPLGFGLLSLLRSTSSVAMGEGMQVIASIGLGILYVGPQMALLAPLKVEDNAQALALMSYLRTFGQTFGITIGTTILQNGLLKSLPSSFLAQIPSGAQISYAIIPTINSLPQPLQAEVKAAFGTSVSHIWYFVAGLGVLGLVLTLPMQALELHLHTDESWGFEEREKKSDVESGSHSRATTPANTEGEPSEKTGVPAGEREA